ncbi:MAG TPA: DoxX family protein [Thermoanaerobaculia bacterium]|jgi:putative oxidoreductase|nr:DoxX family protein [Thermoanaerobaculia bacterium]
MNRWAPKILGVMRILTGVMFACHGAQKLFGAFGGFPPGVTPPAWIHYGAGAIEFFGGALIAIGLLTRPVAFLASGTMAIAYFYGHARNGFWPKVNQGELAVIYCWLWLYLAAAGPGAFALDNLFFFNRRARAN